MLWRVAAALIIAGFVALGHAGAAPERAGARSALSQNGAELAIARFTRPPAILVLDVGTGRARELPSRVRPVQFGRPAWSPDGASIAYAGVSGGAPDSPLTDIFVVGADGSGLRRLTATGRASEPLWSPDGATVVFSDRAPGDRFRGPVTLWAVSAAGGGQRELTHNDGPTRDVAGSFAADSQTLLFTRVSFTRVTDPGVEQPSFAIYVLDLATGSVERLLERAAMPAYSPDGSRVAYVTEVDENGSLSYGDTTHFATELYVMASDGGDRRRLTHTRDLNELSPAWSSDGSVIAFVRGKQYDNAEGYAVMAITAAGTCVRFLAADPSFGAWYGGPAWRPATAVAAACPPARPGAGILLDDFRPHLRRARAFRGYPLFWAGERVADLYFSDVFISPSRGPGGRATTHTFSYRNCRLTTEGSGCAGFQLQLWPACARVPADVDFPADGLVRIRGVEGVFFEGGNRLEIVTGKTTIVIFAGGRAAALRAARALRGLNVSVGVRDKLPSPAPGVLRRENRCR